MSYLKSIGHRAANVAFVVAAVVADVTTTVLVVGAAEGGLPKFIGHMEDDNLEDDGALAAGVDGKEEAIVTGGDTAAADAGDSAAPALVLSVIGT